MNAPHFGGHFRDKNGSRRSYVYIQTLNTGGGVKRQTAAHAILEEVFDPSCFLLQNILKIKKKTQSVNASTVPSNTSDQLRNTFSPLYVESFQRPGSSRPSQRALMSDVFLAPALSSAPDRSSAAAQPGSYPASSGSTGQSGRPPAACRKTTSISPKQCWH